MRNKIILTTNHPAPYIDLWIDALENNYDIDIFYAKKSEKEKGWKKYKYSKGNLYADFSFFKKLNIFRKNDLVILGGWGLKENVLLCIALMPFKTKVAFFCDHPIPESSKTSLLMRTAKRMIMKSADYIFPASESCKNYLHHTYKVSQSRMYVFPYAHSLPHSNINDINRGRSEQLIMDDRIGLFIANRFVKRKGYDVVIKAFKRLHENHLLQHFKIRIAGNGEDFAYYKNIFNELSDEIDLLGWIENDEYEEELDRCDVFLHASIFEPFGIPPLDAMQRGKQVIVSDGVKSTDYMIDQENRGIHIYPANDECALADQLKRIINNKTDLYKKNDEIITLVDQEYSIEKNINAIKIVLVSKSMTKISL